MKPIKAKKKYGQNFLKDRDIILRIIESMPSCNRHVVEIGPGLGDLTRELVKYKEVTAYEVDTELYTFLRSSLFNSEIKEGKLKLICSDVLTCWDRNSLYDSDYDLIANLPYYIATNIILRALDDSQCRNIIVMVQKEVAQKFTAREGEKAFSSLGVIVQCLCLESKLLFDVPAESFDPIPNVVSSVLYLKKNTTATIEKGFKEFLSVAFSQPRKKLSKNLLKITDNSTLLRFYDELGINDTTRPHEVSASLYRQLYTKVINERNRTQPND